MTGNMRGKVSLILIWLLVWAPLAAMAEDHNSVSAPVHGHDMSLASGVGADTPVDEGVVMDPLNHAFHCQTCCLPQTESIAAQAYGYDGIPQFLSHSFNNIIPPLFERPPRG